MPALGALADLEGMTVCLQLGANELAHGPRPGYRRADASLDLLRLYFSRLVTQQGGHYILPPFLKYCRHIQPSFLICGFTTDPP